MASKNAPPPAPSTQEAPQSFEAALAEIEQIVRRMESAAVPLDDSLRLYERGTFLIQHCQQRLDAAERQVEQVTRGRDGRLEANPPRQ